VQKIRLYIIDDHKVLVDGLCSLLNGHPDIEIVGKNTLPVKAFEEIKQLKPNVVLSDIQMPEMTGIELTKNIKRVLPDTRVIALSMFGDYTNISEMMNAGVSGYLLKNSDKQDIVNAIETVFGGKTFFDEHVKEELARAEQAQPENDENKPNITQREREIIQLIAKECSNAQIAEKLFISERTVETHRKNIFRKTGTKSVVGLLKFAMEHNLL
jgi:two-component system, NarL family, nitrate/nitrite response regulator NarL